MLMASNGYIVIAPNRRGCTGFGIEWTEDVTKNFGGHANDDLLSAIDSIAKEPFVDENRLGCVGASYGGFSVFYLESHLNIELNRIEFHTIFNTALLNEIYCI